MQWDRLSPGLKVAAVSIAVVTAAMLLSFVGWGIYAIATSEWAWAQGTPKKGTVIEKRHEDARTYQEWDSCKFRTTHPEIYTAFDGKTKIRTVEDCQGGYETRFDDEDWKLHLKECRKNDDGEQKCRDGWREVDSLVWKRLQVGQFYNGKG